MLTHWSGEYTFIIAGLIFLIAFNQALFDLKRITNTKANDLSLLNALINCITDRQFYSEQKSIVVRIRSCLLIAFLSWLIGFGTGMYMAATQ